MNLTPYTPSVLCFKRTVLRLFILGAVFFLISEQQILAQQTATISGYIEDDASKERLISAAVFEPATGKGIVSNNYGFYSLTLKKGPVKLNISYVGYQNQEIEIDLKGDISMNFTLNSADNLQTVEVSSKKDDRIENRVQMSQTTVSIAMVKKVPVLFGEADILKVLQLMPGVQGGDDGTSGLYVRGGSPDQNLVLLDGVPVYQVSHIGGFLSVFNSDAIKNVTLTKGGFPARFGGRLSSVLEIDMKDGNLTEFHGEGGIGTLASRLTLEGPIVKNKASFMVSYRRSYIDVLMKPIIKAAARSAESGNSNFKSSSDLDLFFYDMNAKLSWRINDKHRLLLSAYAGDDKFGFSQKTTNKVNGNYDQFGGGFGWGNLVSALRWNWIVGKKLFTNTTLTYSRYNVLFGGTQASKFDTVTSSNLAQYKSGIEDFALKSDWNYILNPNHNIRFGGSITDHTYSPGAFQISAKENTRSFIDTVLGTKSIKSLDSYLYVEDELRWGALRANVGLHFSAFKVQDKTYTSLQPRVGLNYPLSPSVALKASYVIMQQYINLLTNERIGLPTDLWVPSTARVKPQDAWQAAIGVAKTFEKGFEFSTEVYYKPMDNILSYKEGANFLNLDDSWENRIVQGKGLSYGGEFLLEKKSGKTTGWIGYTLSWNTRTFKELNNGNTYPFKFDRRHDFEMVISHKLSKRWEVTGAWQYGTGNAVSLATERYRIPNGFGGSLTNLNNPLGQGYYDDQTIVTSKNSFRMPAFHRLDVNFNYERKRKRYTQIWNIGAYNAYNRPNPLFLFPATKQVDLGNGNFESRPVVRQFSLFPILPYLGLNFKF
jgi:hypothetical protein